MIIDDPVRAALDGSQSHLAQRVGGAVRFHPDVSPFAAQPRDDAEVRDLARLVGPGGIATYRTLRLEVPPGWELEWELPGVQMILDGPGKEDPDVVVLGPSDVPAMIDLVARTKPGPFHERTIEMGRYLGIREHGALVAMAGERLHPPGGTEISAVCTDAAHRGRGLASRLVLAVAAGIQERGETPFLHTSAANTRAIRLYDELGFRLCARPSFADLRAPGESRAPESTLGEI